MDKAPNLVYLIEHPDVIGFRDRGFSHFQSSLVKEGYQFKDLRIEHILLDAKVPMGEVDDMFLVTLEERGDKYRYINVIYWGFSWMGRISTSMATRNKDLRAMVSAYVDQTNTLTISNPPYFVVTQPECAAEVRAAFEKLGVTVEPIERKPVG